MQIKAKLLEYSTGNFQGTDYATIKARSEEIANNRILKFKVDFKKVGDVSNLVDSDVVLVCEVVSGQNDAATIRVVSVEAA